MPQSPLAAVGPEFPVAVKLNSDDFRKGGSGIAEMLRPRSMEAAIRAVSSIPSTISRMEKLHE